MSFITLNKQKKDLKDLNNITPKNLLSLGINAIFIKIDYLPSY